MLLCVPVRQRNKSFTPLTRPREPVNAIRIGRADRLSSVHLVHSCREESGRPLIDGEILPFRWVRVVCHLWIYPGELGWVRSIIELGRNVMGIQVGWRRDCRRALRAPLSCEFQNRDER